MTPRNARRTGAGPGWSVGLARVRTNRTDGALTLARETLVMLDRDLRRSAGASSAETRAFAAKVARDLATTQPAMAIFSEWSSEWRAILRSVRGPRAGPRLRGWVRRWRRRLREEPLRVRRVAARRMPARARVVTISHSATVAQAFLSVPVGRRPREIIALESRPGGEGRQMARELRRGGLPARWVRDRTMPEAVRAADLVVIGADTVEPNGDVIHKVGTRALAAQARRVGVPLVVIAGRSKWRSRPPPRFRLPPRFDRTPARFISEYWSDRGASRPSGRRRGTPTSQRP